MVSDSVRVGSCVIPVCAADALLWAEGRLSDRDLLLDSPLVPEAVFIVNLPDRASYVECLRQAAYWRSRGAVCLITRTGTPQVASHLEKNGCLATHHEQTNPPKSRYLAPPEVFSRW